MKFKFCFSLLLSIQFVTIHVNAVDPDSRSTNTATRPSNTGNNPGNANASGYNTRPSTSVSNTKTPPTNTGNNPGNANASGYNARPSTTTTTKPPSTNTGNNPGNANASGYNTRPSSGGSMSTTSSSGSTTNSTFGLTISNVTNTLRSYSQSAITTAKSFYGATSPNFRAAVAGQKALEASITGTTNIDSLAAKRIMERAMYMGRLNHLVNIEGVSVGSSYKGLVLGPFEESLKAGDGLAWDMLTDEEKTISRAMDRSFAHYGDFIALPGDITPANGAKTYGPQYHSLTEVQKLALKDGYTFVSLNNAPFDEDGKDVIHTIAELAGHTGDVGGLSYRGNSAFPFSIARGNLKESSDLIIHELDHTGGAIIHRYAAHEFGKQNFSSRIDHEKQDLAILEMGAYGYEQGNIEKFFPDANLSSPQIQYLNSITEQLAFSASTGHSKLYQDLLLKEIKSTYNPHSPVPVDGDHPKIVEALLNSPTLRAIRKTQNEYASYFLD